MNPPLPVAPQPQGPPQQPMPLAVQSAPLNQPTLPAPTPPPVANDQNTGTPAMVANHPLYQDSLNMLSQIGQMGATGQNGQTSNPDGDLNTAENFGVGIAKGGLETADSLSNILGNTLGRVTNALTGRGFTPVTDEQNGGMAINTKADNTTQAVGKGAEQLLEFLAMPESGAADAVKATVDGTSVLGKAAVLATKALEEGTKSVALGQLHNDTNAGLDFAAGAAAPAIGAGVSSLWDKLPSIIGKITNIPDTVKTLLSTPDGTKLLQEGAEAVKANPQAPYVGIAHDVFQGMMAGKQAAKDAYQQGLEKVVQLTEGKTYNVSSQIKEISDLLKNDYGLPVQLPRNADGTMSSAVKLVTDTPNGNPFSATETNNIENLMNEMRNASGKSFKGLVNLQKSVDGYFDTDVFGNSKATPYNSVITKLSDIVDKKVSAVAGEAMPTMDAINQQYSKYKQIFNQFGKTFVDTTTGTPQVSTKAESFLSNLLGKNKATLQGNVVKDLEQFTGVPILDRVTGTKAAYDMSNLAGSGKLSTVQKILAKSGKWVGAALGGLHGGVGGFFEGTGIGEGVGQAIGALGNPEAGIKAIKASQYTGAAAAKAADNSEVIGGLAKRFGMK